ncbi:hypothetical protein SeMB42_g02857 [Synchytrium endobioticum]|nr:hypothetical protein SeMB42_g02857 [Synchytrium endobioticum]
MVAFWTIARIRRGQGQLAAQFHKCHTFQSFWSIWKTGLHRKQNDRIKTAKAAKLYHHIILRRAFMKLKKYANEELKGRQNEALAIRHYHRYIALAALRAWWVYAAQSSSKLMQWRVAVRCRCKSLLYRYFKLWEQKRMVKFCDASKRALAVARHLRTIARRSLRAWMLYAAASHWVKNRIDTLQLKHSATVVARLFQHWRAKAIIAHEVRLEVERAQLESAFALMKQVFVNWKFLVSGVKRYREEQNRRIRVVKAAVDNAKLRNALNAWRRYRRYKQYCHSVNAKAKFHFTRHLLSITMTYWITRHHHRKWLRCAHSLADAFHHRHVYRNCIKLWRSSRDNWSQIVNRIFIMPVLHRGQKLMNKTFASWKLYVNKKKDMRSRVKDAQGWRREMVIKRGILAFLTVADPYRGKESSTVTRQPPLGMTRRKWNTVERCARHWLALSVQARARRRQSSSHHSSLHTRVSAAREPAPYINFVSVLDTPQMSTLRPVRVATEKLEPKSGQDQKSHQQGAKEQPHDGQSTYWIPHQENHHLFRVNECENQGWPVLADRRLSTASLPTMLESARGLYSEQREQPLFAQFCLPQRNQPPTSINWKPSASVNSNSFSSSNYSHARWKRPRGHEVMPRAHHQKYRLGPHQPNHERCQPYRIMREPHGDMIRLPEKKRLRC